MTHEHHDGHCCHEGHAPTTGDQACFSAAEAESLVRSDKQAATFVVGLMIGIFTIGLFLYLGVAVICHQSNWGKEHLPGSETATGIVLSSTC